MSHIMLQIKALLRAMSTPQSGGGDGVLGSGRTGTCGSTGRWFSQA